MHAQSTPSRLQFVRLCECGCGQPTLLAHRTDTRRGQIDGQPLRFIARHHFRTRNNPGGGGVYTDKDGYVWRFCPEHPAAKENGFVREHRLVMEKHLGRYLTPDEIVHHDDENPSNNDLTNLVLTNRPDHARLHWQCPTWSRDHDCCIECGTTSRPHRAQGRCGTCYQRWRYRTDPTWHQYRLQQQRARRRA